MTLFECVIVIDIVNFGASAVAKGSRWEITAVDDTRSKMMWTKQKEALWNAGLISTTETSRSIGTPKRRWEDDLNEFIDIEETKESRRGDLSNDNTWIRG